MGYKTLFVRNSEKLRLYLDNIIIETDKGEIRFLISDLKFLIIDNYKCTLSVQLINKLMDNNVALVLCDLTHSPNAQLIPISGHYAASYMINQQVKWPQEVKEIICQKIIKAKIQSQIEILIKNNKNDAVINKLKEFELDVKPNDATNREGLAAKMYFREMYGIQFVRFNKDIVNAGLDYGYSIFRSLISAILVSKGLLLNLGIFHRGATNEANLADDIIEVFRPIVDDYVLNNLCGIGQELLTLQYREDLIKLTDKKILFDNQMHTTPNCIEMYIESILRCFENGNVDEFKAPSLNKMI